MKTAMPMLPKENQMNTNEPKMAVDQAKIMCTKDKGTKRSITPKAHKSLPMSHSFCSMSLGMLSVAKEVK
jgi:hypothetical protein